jgi:GNAT superfamily N-acetyltransferase
VSGESSPAPALSIRDAVPGDLPAIVEFNRLLALETESKVLDAEVLHRGVAQALADPDRIRYWVATITDSSLVAGQAAITREWSDWRNGWLWWFQSVYVAQPFRRQGVFRALYRHIHGQARSQRDVIGLRLYVEDANERAHQTYQALGMTPGGYSVYQDLWIERYQSS